MRKVGAVVAAAALAACGGGSKNDGGGGGGTSVKTTGNVTLSATESISSQLTGGCDFLGTGTAQGFATLLVAASDVANQCALVQAGQSKANGKGVLIAVTRADLFSPTPPTIGQGTYAITAEPQASGTSATYAFARVSADDASCAELPGAEDATAGTITITSIANGRVQGTIDATTASGRITGSFDAPSCAVSLPTDFCTTLNPVPPRSTCVP